MHLIYRVESRIFFIEVRAMPLFEYKCNKCGNQFEYLQGYNETDVRVACPKCESGDVSKMFSAFSSPGCDGGCGSSPLGSWRFG